MNRILFETTFIPTAGIIWLIFSGAVTYFRHIKEREKYEYKPADYTQIESEFNTYCTSL
jgi:hypothetical protein